MSFRLVRKSVTLNDFERRNGHYFALFQRIRYLSARTAQKWLKLYLNFLQQKCSPKLLVSSDIHFRQQDVGNPFTGGLNARGVAKYSDFGPIESYISETVQDRR